MNPGINVALMHVARRCGALIEHAWLRDPNAVTVIIDRRDHALLLRYPKRAREWGFVIAGTEATLGGVRLMLANGDSTQRRNAGSGDRDLFVDR